MKLGLLKMISREILAGSGEVPKWADAMLGPLNDFIEKVGLALQNRLTFEDNFLCTVVSREFTSGVQLDINPIANAQRNLRTSGVLLISAGGLSVDQFGWVQKPNGNLGVTVTFNPSATATCTILILLR